MNKLLEKSSKSKAVKKLLQQAIDILDAVGIPVESLTLRRLERMAACFCAVAGVTKSWKDAKGASDGVKLKTREIIPIVNKHFEEEISSGSYDDVRRQDIKLLTFSGLIINPGAVGGSATNDPTRGYALSDSFRDLIRQYGTANWPVALAEFKVGHRDLRNQLERNRELDQIPATLPDGSVLKFSPGEHNVLQKAIVEEFLPRFAPGARVLYIGDTSEKYLHIDREKLKDLNFFALEHEELPDILAFVEERNWLFLIEAVHSIGPMSEIRVMELKERLKECTAGLVFVTAFLTKSDFRKWMLDIAWETEVWIADNPTHLIHFDGSRFLGPY